MTLYRHHHRRRHYPQTATKTIAARVARAGIDDLTGLAQGGALASEDRDKQKKLDVVAVGWEDQTNQLCMTREGMRDSMCMS